MKLRRVWLLTLVVVVWSISAALVPANGPPGQSLRTTAGSPQEFFFSQQGSDAFNLHFHPDGALYAGDLVSFEVISRDPSIYEGEVREVSIRIEGNPPSELGSKQFDRYDDRKELRAIFSWVWDTSSLPPGDYMLTLTTAPQAFTWTETITLQPAQARPENERGAVWKTANTVCCEIHYISGTAAERDLEDLKTMVDEEARLVSEQMGVPFDEPVVLTLLPRVLGHGGFAGDQIYLSYPERNYAGGTTRQVLHHELVHILDGRMGGELRPSILVESLAVYFSGGHFKPEPLEPRARALLSLGEWIPLHELADGFYAAQHEAGYLEAAALVEYMIAEYGWEEFNAFYRDIHPATSGGDLAAINQALRAHFDLSLEMLEKQLIAHLESLPEDPVWKEDVRLTIRFYDTVREYQQELDPSAYFRNVWLPSGKEMREKDLVADYLRRPNHLKNRHIEQLLTASEQALRSGQYDQAGFLIDEASQALAVERSLRATAWVFPQRERALPISVTN